MLRFPCGFHPPYCFGIAGKCLGTARVTQQTAAISAVSITLTYQRFGQVRRPSSQRPTGNGDSHHLSNPTPAGKPDIAAVGSGKDIVAKSTSSLRERASTAQKNHFNSQLEVLCQPLHLFLCGGWDAGGFATNRRSCDDSFGSGGVGCSGGPTRSGGGAAGESGPHKSAAGGGRARGASKRGAGGGNGGGVCRDGEGEPRSLGNSRVGSGGGGVDWGGCIDARSGARADWYEVRRFLEVGPRSAWPILWRWTRHLTRTYQKMRQDL